MGKPAELEDRLIGQRHLGRASRSIVTRSVSEESGATRALAYASGYDKTPKWRCPIRTFTETPLR